MSQIRTSVIIGALLLGAAASTTFVNPARADSLAGHGITTRESVTSSGQQGLFGSAGPTLAGRKVAFYSKAHLDPRDQNLWWEDDVFLRDLILHETELVSLSSSGEQCDCFNGSPDLSLDGRYVAFGNLDCRYAFCEGGLGTGLVPGDDNHKADIVVRDLRARKTELVSVAWDGGMANEGSDSPSISADGRYVAFESDASNLVAGDTNGTTDVFVRDREAKTTERVNVSSSGEQANGVSYGDGNAWISADGRYVAFTSSADNLVPKDPNGPYYSAFVHDRKTGKTQLIDPTRNGTSVDGVSISADGDHVAFASTGSDVVPGDTNAYSDVFVRDRTSGRIERVSVNSAGEQGTCRPRVFCESNDPSALWPAISNDGRWVAFHSSFTNLVEGDDNFAQDTFLHDRVTGRTEDVNVSSTGEQGHGGGFLGSGEWGVPAISGDGMQVAFDSYSSNLVPDDRNRTVDVFVHSHTSPD